MVDFFQHWDDYRFSTDKARKSNVLKPLFATLIFLLLSVSARGQGTAFIYDQQSSTDETPFPGGAVIQQNTPIGQSFTPTLPNVGFVRLKLYDHTPGNSQGAKLLVNIRATSVTGTILGTSTAVTLPDGFANPVNFVFSSLVPVTSGTTYFLEPVVQTGDLWTVDTAEYGYLGGTAVYQGQPSAVGDFWFREGLAVPEPSAAWLIFFSIGMIIVLARIKPGNQTS